MSHFEKKLIEAASSEYKMSRSNAEMYLKKILESKLQAVAGKMERSRTYARVWDGPEEMKGYGIAKEEDLEIINKQIGGDE